MVKTVPLLITQEVIQDWSEQVPLLHLRLLLDGLSPLSFSLSLSLYQQHGLKERANHEFIGRKKNTPLTLTGR